MRHLHKYTSATLRENIKGCRRDGQRRIPKGTEPCMLWALDGTNPKHRETEAHITVSPSEIRITIPIGSEFNFLMLNRPDYEYVAVFVTGKGTPLYVRFFPTYESNDGVTSEFSCKIPEYSGSDIRRFKSEYRI